ncbi:MAG: PEGA domain-containing protein [Chitinispirillia bacterium]|jgi:hypothetical protein
MEYIECDVLPNVGYCSDNDCPCSVTQIQHGTGYLYISPEVVKFRKNALTQAECRKKLARFTEKDEYLSLQQYEPILICDKGAKKRNLDLNIAAEDARVWWETQKAPLRATPFAVKTSAKGTIDATVVQKQKIPVAKKIQKPLSESENDFLHDSIKNNFQDSYEHSSLKNISKYSKKPRFYSKESSVDVVSQYAGTPLEELAMKMNENTNTGYSKTDYSTTDTTVPYNSKTDTFHQYDKSLLPPQRNGRRKKHFQKSPGFINFLKNSAPIVLTILITAFLSFAIIKFTDIKSYIIKKIGKIQLSAEKGEIKEETITEKHEKAELIKDFFNNFYSFKDNQYYGTIKFSDVTNESGYYEQEVFLFGKENRYVVTGSFVYNKEKIVFRPDGKNKDVIWMLQSLNLDSGTAFFYDPVKEKGENAEILLEVKDAPEHVIIISSDPEEAVIILKDSILGQTPLSMKNPLFHGLYEFTIEKEGYNTEIYELEYTGGVVEKHLVLTGISDSSELDTSANAEIGKSSDSLLYDSSISFSEASEETSQQSQQSQQSVIKRNGAAPGTIFISSLPPNAEVYMDGVKIGNTNIDYCQITAGTHTMRFVKGTKKLVKKMTFTAGRNPSQLVHLE